MARRNTDFLTIRSEGGLLPADLLTRVLDPKSKLDGTKPADYGLSESERLNEVITQSWNRLRKHWADFRAAAAELPEGEPGTGLTNDKWSLPLLRELGFGLLPTSAAPAINGRTFAINRFFGPVPVHLVGCGLSLDRRAAGVRGAAAANPHGLLQEFLNRAPGHLWGFVSNGLRLRVLRDSQALSRQSFLEFDLEAMFAGEVFSDFVLLWLMTHASRFAPRQSDRPDTCWLEKWTQDAEQEGARALGDLRSGVERALQILGEGFTSHPRNTALRDLLRSDELNLKDFHSQLLRVVYRLIFLFVAEDRTLDGQPVLHARDNSEAARKARERYATHYSGARLRDLAGKIKGSRHGDLWRQFQLVVSALSGDASSGALRQHLALPALGTLLWNPASSAALNNAELTNHDLLEALRHLAFTRQGNVLRPVDFRNLGAEELGGVYESLLALTPQVSADGLRFSFAEFAGSERKTSGSYYTPDSLVQCLLDSALDPVVEQAIKNKTAPHAEQAILALKICDPAVGSGHFLVGAAHRLARHLARVRALAQGETEPSPLLYQQALRDVIGRCLYGVDINPMAAELCRVGLWLEALEPGKPLSFLDHHIRVGNSLLGTTPELIAGGLPDEAFNPIEGDDKKVCSALKKRNKAEREGQRDMLHLMAAEPSAVYNSLATSGQELDQAPDDSLDAIARKAERYQRLVVSPEYRHRQLVADAWCAAFVWPKAAGTPDAITTDAIRRLEQDACGLADPQRIEVEKLVGEYQFFHWHLAFPEVFARGGFDCILANPPWERVKLQEKEWFAVRNPEIANAPNAATRKRLIEALKRNDPALHRNFLNDARKAEGESHLLRSSGRYPLCGRGDINLYAVFAEGMRTLLNESGRAGAVLPTGIATDDTTKFFFQDVVGKRSLTSLFDFENRLGIFPDIDSRVKFCLFTAGRGLRPTADAADFVFFAHAVDDLRDPERHFSLSMDDIALLNPNTRTCPIFWSARDATLARAIYRRVRPLGESEVASDQLWCLRIPQGLFHQTNDADLLREQTVLERDGFAYGADGHWRRGQDTFVMMYEGRMIQAFNHRASSVGISDTNTFRSGVALEVTEKDWANPSFVPTPRYWVSADETEARIPDRYPWRWLPCFKDVTSATNERTMIAAVIPRTAVVYSIRVIFALGHQPVETAALVACLNSFCFDYLARGKTPGNHITDYIVRQLPLIGPAALARAIPPARASIAGQSPVANHDFLLNRSLELSYTAWDLEPFARDCGWDGPPFRWDEERRFLIRCELDAAFFHLHLPADAAGKWCPSRKVDGSAHDETPSEFAELTRHFSQPRDAVAYIMDTFPIVRRKDQERYAGDYRTKRVILEIYDAMQEALRTGQPYQTRLDPPPGSPLAADGSFAPYATIATAPPSHIHLPRDAAGSAAERQLSDLVGGFPNEPFTVRLGTRPGAQRVRVIPVATDELAGGDWVVLATPALRLHGAPSPVAIGKLAVEVRTDAASGERHVLVSVRGEGGVAQARLSEGEWRSLRSVGRVEDLH